MPVSKGKFLRTLHLVQRSLMQSIQCKGLACCQQVTQLAWGAAGAHLQCGGGVVRARAARAADQGGALPDQPAVLTHFAAPAARVRPVRPLPLPPALAVCCAAKHQRCVPR